MSIDVAIIDLGTGNLFSVQRGLERAGAAPRLVTSAEEISRAPRLVLPGVGSFADASRRVHALELAPLLRDALDKGTPVLGICLGMHLLFEEGDEEGTSPGLGLLPGRVELLDAPGLTVPHVGWQRVEIRRPCALLPEPDEAPWLYFSHSYVARARDEDVSAWAQHGEPVPAVVARGTLYGIQPHPEKSGEAGVRFFRRFLELPPRKA